MLTNHRRAFRFSFGLLASVVFLLVAVGRHPEQQAPVTNLAFIGEFDGMVLRWADDVRNGVFTAICRFLSLIGGGLVASWRLDRDQPVHAIGNVHADRRRRAVIDVEPGIDRLERELRTAAWCGVAAGSSTAWAGHRTDWRSML